MLRDASAVDAESPSTRARRGRRRRAKKNYARRRSSRVARAKRARAFGRARFRVRGCAVPSAPTSGRAAAGIRGSARSYRYELIPYWRIDTPIRYQRIRLFVWANSVKSPISIRIGKFPIPDSSTPSRAGPGRPRGRFDSMLESIDSIESIDSDRFARVRSIDRRARAPSEKKRPRGDDARSIAATRDGGRARASRARTFPANRTRVGARVRATRGDDARLGRRARRRRRRVARTQRDDDDDAMESVSRSSVSDQARSFGVGSLNTRPRKKVFRGLRQPRPLFGRSYQDGSPNSPGGASGPSPSPGSANGFAAMAARFRKVGPDNISPQFGAPLARASGASPRERITAFRVEDEDD